MALAVGAAAAVLQILFGLMRFGILGEFFPVTAVHGMLAAIGVIIVLKQFPVALGVAAKGEPLELLEHLPHHIAEANPAIATIGMSSLLIMFLWPILGRRMKLLRAIPSQVVVIVLAVGLGTAFDLLHEHNYTLQGHKYPLGEQYLVAMPGRIFGLFDEMAFPDFSALARPLAWKWMVMFFIIGSLESVLSAKAVDLIDPWKRNTDMNRDVMAVGAGNLLCALVGGLPMISEIVRSRANIDNGARTRFANMWHGICLLVCVAFLPTFLHRIPLAALAAMLVYTGYRLAHPSEFLHVYRIGREQLLIFTATLVGVLATDLLIGIAIGIGVKMLIHLMNGVGLKDLFKTYLEVEQVDDQHCIIRAGRSAVFSNWIPFRRQIEDLGMVQRQNVVIDLSGTRLVDHSVMDKLHQMQQDFELEGLTLEIVGLESHRPVTSHELAARRRTLSAIQRLTIVVDPSLEEELTCACVARGAAGFTVLPGHGAGRSQIVNGLPTERFPCARIEVIAPAEVCERIVAYLRQQVLPRHRATVCLETVYVLRQEEFAPAGQVTTFSAAPAVAR
jgi:MFS superfamily sulfate permease-like transporter